MDFIIMGRRNTTRPGGPLSHTMTPSVLSETPDPDLPPNLEVFVFTKKSYTRNIHTEKEVVIQSCD